MAKKKAEWEVYREMLWECARYPEKMVELFTPYVGKTFTSPDGKIVDRVAAVDKHGLQISREIELTTPADCVQLRLSSKAQ